MVDTSTLASVADLQARLGTSVTIDAARAQVLLQDATGIIRDFTGQHFTRVTNDVVTLRMVDRRVILPQRPADQPTALVINGTSDLSSWWWDPITTAAWWWDGIDTIDLSPPLAVPATDARPYGFLEREATLTVTYSHGYTEIPGGLIAVVCQMVARVLTGPQTPGLSSEAIDDYKYTVAAGFTSGSMFLTDDEKKTLSRYRRRIRSAVLR